MNVWQSIKLAVKAILLLFLLALLFAYAMFQGGFVSWFLFYSVTITLIFNSVFLFYPLQWITVDRKVEPKHVPFGGKSHVTLTLTNKMPFPFLYLVVTDGAPLHLIEKKAEESPSQVYVFLFKKQVSFTYEISGMMRGEYGFAEVTLQSGDVFGFFVKEKKVNVTSTVIVYPRLLSLHSWQDLLNGSKERPVETNVQMEDDLSIAGVREYVPGDRMTSVDWKVSARTGKLITKEFEAQQGIGSTLVLDTALSSESNYLFETAVEFGAALTESCFKKGVPLGFAVTTEKGVKLPEKSDQPNFQRMYQELAKVQMDDRDERLLFTSSLPNRMVIVTTTLTESFVEECQHLLRRRYDIVVVFTGGIDSLREDEEQYIDRLRLYGISVRRLQQKDETFYVI